MYLFPKEKGYFTFREIMQFLFLFNVSISVQQNMKVLKRSLFVNDLNNSAKVLDPVLFEGDTNLFCFENNIRTLFETVK